MRSLLSRVLGRMLHRVQGLLARVLIRPVHDQARVSRSLPIARRLPPFVPPNLSPPQLVLYDNIVDSRIKVVGKQVSGQWSCFFPVLLEAHGAILDTPNSQCHAGTL